MQSEFWAEFKSENGWHVRKAKGLYVYEHTLPLGNDFLYIPEISVDDGESIASTLASAQSALSINRGKKTIFGRAEFLEKFDTSKDLSARNAQFIKSKDEVQPAYHQELDLTSGYAAVVAQYKSKCRYKIRLAEKHGVQVSEDNSRDAIDEFNEINADTAKRKGYSGRNAKYIGELIHKLEKYKLGSLWVARYNNRIISGTITIFYGGRASYVYGASRNENREVMAPRLLHDRLIKESIRRGCSIYDFIGVAPEDAKLSHPWAGISSFKRDFGGATVRYMGSYDRIYKPIEYFAYKSLRRSNQ